MASPAHTTTSRSWPKTHIDLVAVVVRVPRHHQIVIPALEAEDMASLAPANGVVTPAGLQGRHDPTLRHLRRLVDTGWLGEVRSVRVSLLGGGALSHRSGDAWMGQRRNGANTLTIVGGHTLDYLAFCFGELKEVSARTATQHPRWQLSDTGEVMTEDAPQISPVTLLGARGDRPLEKIPVPDPSVEQMPGLPAGPARNITRGYQALGTALRQGHAFAPDFQHARRLHEILDAIETSSREGRTVQLSEPAGG